MRSLTALVAARSHTVKRDCEVKKKTMQVLTLKKAKLSSQTNETDGGDFTTTAKYLSFVVYSIVSYVSSLPHDSS